MVQEVFDGNVSFRGGQNAGILPDRIGDDQYAAGINVTTTDGGLGPRPGFIHLEIEVMTPGGVENLDGTTTPYSTIFNTGKFQMSSEYRSDNGYIIIAVISGIIFLVDPIRLEASVLEVADQASVETNIHTYIEPPTQRLDQFKARYNGSDAGRFYVIFDYPDVPIIIEGASARRANPEDFEVLNAEIGTFNQSRLFIGTHVHEFTAGDPVGNRLTPDAPITFEEILVSAAPFPGQAFSLGTTNINNPITAMGFMQLADTSTGIGPLFIATKKGIYSYRSDIARSQWENSRFGSLINYSSGIAGQRAFVNVNSDLIFMSGDGKIRSLHTARASQGKWADAPIDREVRNWTKTNDTELTYFTASAYHNNRVYITVNPHRTKALTLDGDETRDYAFSGLAVLEMDNISGLLRDATPVWAGLWTGLQFMDLTAVDDDLYMWSKDPGSVNRLYKLDENSTHDVTDGEVKQITSRFITRQYTYDNPFVLKEESFIDMAMTDLEGDITIRVDRKPESSTKWLKHRTWKHFARTEQCDLDDCTDMDVLLAQAFRELNFGSAESRECNPISGDSFEYFRKVQYRVTINAKNWKLQDIRVGAIAQITKNNIAVVCNSSADKVVVADCNDVDDWLIHSTPHNTYGSLEAWL